MPDHQLIGRFGSDLPTALAAAGRRVGDPPGPAEVVLRVFPAPSWDAAVAIYNRCKQAGIAATLGGKDAPSSIGEYWSFPGVTGHLMKAAVRLGISTGALHRCEADPTLKNLSTRIGEAYGRYTKVRGPGKESRAFTPLETGHVNVLLDRCDEDVARLHGMAAAAMDAAQECRAAHGMPLAEYRYRVAGPNEEATVALRAELDVARVEIERLNREALERGALHQADLDRLRAENAELLDQNKQLAAMVESLTQPAPTDPPTTADTDRRQPPTTADTSSPSSQSKPTPPRPPHNKGR